MIRLLPFFILTFFPLGFLVAENAVDEITSYSLFKKIDLKDLEGDRILADRGQYSQMVRGLRVETCFILPQGLNDAEHTVTAWDPSLHEKMDTYVNHFITESGPEAFKDLKFDASKGPVRLFLQSTFNALKSEPEFPVTPEELARLRALGGSLASKSATDPEFITVAETFWREVLEKRYTAFMRGGISQIPSSDTKKYPVITEELPALLAEPQPIHDRFIHLYPASNLTPSPGLKLAPYYQLQKADRTAAIILGCYLTDEKDNRVQILDIEYYVSHTYFASATLYELHPVVTEKGPATLVWRADLVSAPMYQWLRGVDAMAAGALMVRSVKEEVLEIIKGVKH